MIWIRICFTEDEDADPEDEIDVEHIDLSIPEGIGVR